MEVIENLKKFFLEQKFIKKNDALHESDSLLERGIIDSVAIQELIAFIEKTYNITIDEDDLMPDNFDSLLAIKNYINAKLP